MGKEAECVCRWNGAQHKVKALIEPPELILRGEMRRRFPIAELKQIDADGEHLRFAFHGERFSLALGNALATKWAKALTAPPPSLARKLGITGETRVRMVGEADDDALRAALSAAKGINNDGAEVILARVNTPGDLAAALRTTAKQLVARVPIWFIYPKGKGQALTGNDVRSTALAAGIVDTKVCAVSPRLTALRFVRRRADH